MSGEAALWCAVVRLAVADARAGDEEAVRWFRRGGKDYRDVCAMAGVDPDAVRERMLAEMPTPVEPAPAVVDLMARLRALQRVKAA